MPQAFKDTYPNAHVIIDCTELLIKMLTSFRSQSATFSSYRTANDCWEFPKLDTQLLNQNCMLAELRTKQVTKYCGIDVA